MIAAIVLAAGASTRMGRPKQLLPLGGGTVLSTVVSRLLDAPVDRVVVVLGHEAESMRRGARLPVDPRLDVVENVGWAEGMATSLGRGVKACAAAEAVLVALGDQPDIDPDTVTRLIEAFRAGAPLAVPFDGERAGHPVLFSRALFKELLGLTGDVGAREVVRRHLPQAARIPARRLADLDTEQEYRAFLGASAGEKPPS